MAQQYLLPAGRVLLSLIFVLSGISKIMDWPETVQFMQTQGLPMVPLLLGAAIVVEILGGLSVLIGWHARWGAWLLFLYLIPVTLILHNFWAFTGAEQQMQLVNFLKNLAIMGGLLLVAAYDGAAWVSVRETEAVSDAAAPQRRRAAG
jgi:putative oxidoreductase